VSDVADVTLCKILRQGCFDGSTIVLTDNGPKPIRDIVAGDRVRSYDTTTNEWSSDLVLAAFSLPHSGVIVDITVDGDSLRITEQHPIWVVSGQGLASRPPVLDLSANEQGMTEDGRWVAAVDLRVGDIVLAADGRELTVDSVSLSMREQTVYNLTIESARTFAVGSQAILVHNGPACTPEQFAWIKANWEKVLKFTWEQGADGKKYIVYKTGARSQSLINAVRALMNGGEITYDIPGRGLVTIKYNKGFADFTPYMYNHPKARVNLETMGKKPDWDIDEAWKESGLDRAALKAEWRWHHTENLGELILVPKDVHEAAKHTGGAAIFAEVLRRWADLTALNPDLFSL